MGLSIKSTLLPLLLLLLLTCVAVWAFSHGGGMTKSGFESMAATLAPLYLPVTVSPNSPCGQALLNFADSLASNSSRWAFNMVDSWGKTRDGLGMLNNRYYGNFDECVHTAGDGMTGKFCIIYTYPLTDEKPHVLKARPWRPDAPWARDMLKGDIRFAPTAVYSDEISFSTCIPSVCSKQELQESLTKVLESHGVYPDVTYCSLLNPPVEFTSPDIGFTAFVTFLMTLVTCASLVDMWLTYTANHRLAKGGLRYLLVFSAYTNLGKILQVNPTYNPGTISCLHGIRVLSMTWVIYCHQIRRPLVHLANLSSLLTGVQGFLGQVIMNGYPSVDTFFFLSGFLVSYSVLRSAKRTGGRFNVPLFFVHRIIRLVPPIGIVVGLTTTVLRFLASGPVANFKDYWYNICKKYWWKDILFVGNILQETGECISQAWYLGVDMQLYLVAPIIIFPLYRYKSSGKAWLFLLTVFSGIIPAAITYKYDMAPALLQGQGDTTEAFLKRYMMPWCRASPWLVGVWLGYFFYRQGNVRYKMNPLTVITGWSLASVTGFLVVFGMYSYNQVIGAAPYDVITQISYSGLHRLAWGAALAWVVLACHNGYGGVVNSFLSHPAWQPFSRLTYTTYLVALQLQTLIALNVKQQYYFTHLNTVISTVGALFFSVIMGTCVSLVAESPVLGLERLLLTPGLNAANKTHGKRTKEKPNNSEPPQLPPAYIQAPTAITKPSQSPTSQHDHGVFTNEKDPTDREALSLEEAVDVEGVTKTTSL